MKSFSETFKRFSPAAWLVDGMTVATEPQKAQSRGGGQTLKRTSKYLAAATLSIAALSMGTQPLTATGVIRDAISPLVEITMSPTGVHAVAGLAPQAFLDSPDFIPREQWAKVIEHLRSMPIVEEPSFVDSEPLI